MRIIDFPGTNITLKPPGDMTDEQCETIPAMRGQDANGFFYTLVCIEPNAEDRQAIAAGLPIYLKVIGNAFPPIAAFTLDAQGNPNYA